MFPRANRGSSPKRQRDAQHGSSVGWPRQGTAQLSTGAPTGLALFDSSTEITCFTGAGVPCRVWGCQCTLACQIPSRKGVRAKTGNVQSCARMLPQYGPGKEAFTLLNTMALIPFLCLAPAVHGHLKHSYSCHLVLLPNPHRCALLHDTTHEPLASGAGTEATHQASVLL